MDTPRRSAEADAADEVLPPPPERPDCCFGGCAQCVLEDYAEAMRRWQDEVEAIRRRRPPAA